MSKDGLTEGKELSKREYWQQNNDSHPKAQEILNYVSWRLDSAQSEQRQIFSWYPSYTEKRAKVTDNAATVEAAAAASVRHAPLQRQEQNGRSRWTVYQVSTTIAAWPSTPTFSR